MSSATLLNRPVARRSRRTLTISCVACFGEHETGALYCTDCACQRCGDDATGTGGWDGYCEPCSAVLEAEGFFG